MKWNLNKWSKKKHWVSSCARAHAVTLLYYCFLGVLQECDAFVQQLEGPIYNRIETVLTAASKGIASLAEVESTLNEW